MNSIARMLTALAVSAVAFSAAAADTPPAPPASAGDQRPTATPKMTPEEKKAADAKKAQVREDAKKPATTKAEKGVERTGNETRPTSTPPNKMTPDEKKADKDAKRVPPTKEEQDKQAKKSGGG
jgi:Spy/CpxP family protein refolding chaperone